MDVVNATTRSVEQLYFGVPGAPSADLLGGVEMAPGETRSFLFSGTVGPVLRAVWTDGRAVELRGLDPCRNSRVVLAEGIIRAD